MHEENPRVGLPSPSLILHHTEQQSLKSQTVASQGNSHDEAAALHNLHAVTIVVSAPPNPMKTTNGSNLHVHYGSFSSMETSCAMHTSATRRLRATLL